MLGVACRAPGHHPWDPHSTQGSDPALTRLRSDSGRRVPPAARGSAKEISAPRAQVTLRQQHQLGFQRLGWSHLFFPAHIKICTRRVQISKSTASGGPSWDASSLWGPLKSKSSVGRPRARSQATKLSKSRPCRSSPTFAQNRAHLAPSHVATVLV